MNIEDKLLFSEREVEYMTGLNRQRLWQLRKDGKLPFLRIGKVIRYSRENLQDFINTTVQ